MISYPDLPPLRSVIDRHGLLARKSLGQHFLLDGGITDDIVRYAGDVSQGSVIEIGPGPGGLTRSLLKAGASQLFVVEKDDRCIAVMQELQQMAGDRLTIIHGDALEVDLLALTPAPRKIVANLPYNAGTAMLLKWLEEVYASLRGALATKQSMDRHAPDGARDDGCRVYQSLTLMFQKEVAQRIVAQPGGKDFGRLSVLCQWLCECRYDMELPPQAFTPPPKVESAVVTLTPRPQPLVEVRKDTLEKVMAKAFGQRRKMLRQALKGLPVPADALLAAAGIDGSARAEQLSVEALCHLAACLDHL